MYKMLEEQDLEALKTAVIKLLVPGVNGELKRSAILANIEEIKRVDDRTFSLEFTYSGTPRRLGWGGKWYFEVPFLASKKKARSPP